VQGIDKEDVKGACSLDGILDDELLNDPGDAAADDMTEFFDFINPPAFLTPPLLPAQPVTGLDDITKQAPPQ